jgi:ribonuclease BN (tRNA processing enzyme)
MNLRVLGGYGSVGVYQRPSAFLINGHTLLDAGTVPGALTVPEQRAIEHALISHSHLDHTVGLAFLAETLALMSEADGQSIERPLSVLSTAPVVATLQASLFNNAAWPDFSRIPPQGPVLAYGALGEGREQRVGDLWVRPIAVDHTIPTCGFIVHDGHTGLVYSADTGPTTAIWQAARDCPGLAAIILECSFPNRLDALADVAGHLTPRRIERELDKVPPDLPVWIFHIKAPFYDETGEELTRIHGASRLVLLEQGKTYIL